MMSTGFRALRADEVECRVLRMDRDWCQVTLYKDARCDMRMLDERFGPLGWKRTHEVINGNLFCSVGVFDPEHKFWVEKQDVGRESRTEKEKGEASDAFKRACTNWGIGRELYTQPVVFFGLSSEDISESKNRDGNTNFTLKRKVKFSAAVMEIDENQIMKKLIIVDQDGMERFAWEKKELDLPASKVMIEVLRNLLSSTGMAERELVLQISKKFYRSIKALDQITTPEFTFAHAQMVAKQKLQTVICTNQVTDIALELQRVGWDVEAMIGYINKKFKSGICLVEEINIAQYEFIIEALRKKPTRVGP